jgi:hypothetical protein
VARNGARRLVWATIAAALLIAIPRPAAASTDSTLPRPSLLSRALAAFHRLEAAGRVHNRALTVIDYSLPSSQRRLWVIDPQRVSVLFHEFVSHGRGSTTDEDPDHALRFGNEPASHRSSLGTFLTGGSYWGQHGNSLELVGLEPGVNDRALERRIVMHPAAYVSASFRAQSGGRVGRSFGCPALDPAVAPEIIDRIQNGSVLYVAGMVGDQGK